MKVRAYQPEDLPAMIALWNEIVEEGNAFPQEDFLTTQSGEAFFRAQSWSAVAEGEDGAVDGLYILHPNNVGRCGHIANASFAVSARHRGERVGEALVADCLTQARRLGFTLLQFNAVVADNRPAQRLYERMGFHLLGTVPGGFRKKDGRFEDIRLYYITL